MGNVGRSAAVVAALALLAALAVWLGSALAPAAPSRNDASPDPGTREVLAAATGTSTRAGLEAAPVAPPPPRATEDDADGFPTLAVVVQEDPAAPPTGPVTYVYAMPAGARGRDDLFSGPAASVDERGHARLLLPGPGTYDVGVLGLTFARVLALDVAVPRMEPLRLRLPRFEELELAAGPGVPVRQWSLMLRAYDDAASGRACVPGRADTASFDADVAFDPAGSRATVRLPGGVALRVGLLGATKPVLLSPEVVRVPGKTWILRTPGYPLKVRARCVPPERTFGHDVIVSIEFAWGPGMRTTTCWAETSLGPTEPLSGVRLTASARVPHADGMVSWSGEGIVPGSARYQGLSPDGGKRNEIRVDVEVANPPDVDRGWKSAFRPVRVHPPASGREDLRILVCTEQTQSRLDWYAADREAPSVFEVGTFSAWVLAASERGCVAGPLRVAPGPVPDLRLALGGFLVAIPERMPPDGLGEVTIERADGAPFLHRGPSGGGSGTRAELVPGLVLGPFEPGTVEFRIRAGGADFGVVRAEVRAGTHESLRIPALSPARLPR